MGRKGADRTPKQKAADAKRSREMKGKRPKGFGGRGGRRSSSSSSSSPRKSRRSVSATIRHVRKKASLKTLIKGGVAVGGLYLTLKGIKENDEALIAFRPDLHANLVDRIAFDALGVKRLSNVLKLEWPEGVDTQAAGKTIGGAIVFVGGPKAVDKVAAKLPADVKRMRIPLLGMPIATA